MMKRSITFRVDDELFDTLVDAAKKNERPLSQFVKVILRAWAVKNTKSYGRSK